MNKLLVSIFCNLILLLGFIPATFAKIVVVAYTPPAPHNGLYQAKITKIIFDVERDKSGNIISPTHNVVKVITTNDEHKKLMLCFDRDDFFTGSALVAAIGKQVTLEIDKNHHNEMIVGNLYISNLKP